MTSSPGANVPIGLPVEIILNIVEDLGWQPGDIGRLLRTSKTFNTIIQNHESQLSQHFTSHLYPPSPPRPILSSSIPPWITPAEPILSPPSDSSPSVRPRSRHSTPPLRFPYTFPWTSEIHTRHNLLSVLPDSSLLDLTHSGLQPLFETSSRLCATCHKRGLTAFKNHGLATLFGLSDARIAGGCCGSNPANEGTSDLVGERKGQEFWVQQQEAIDLASVLALVWAASQVFDYGKKEMWGKDSSCEHNGHDNSTSAPPTSGTADYDLVERQCIYRELALTHGPYFLWCSINGSVSERIWVKSQLDEGVMGLKEYENGVSTEPAIRSLQSVVLRRFCELSKCEIREGWDEVFDCVGEEVTRYREMHGR